jgi:hypothetical protein
VFHQVHVLTDRSSHFCGWWPHTVRPASPAHLCRLCRCRLPAAAAGKEVHTGLAWHGGATAMLALAAQWRGEGVWPCCEATLSWDGGAALPAGGRRVPRPCGRNMRASRGAGRGHVVDPASQHITVRRCRVGTALSGARLVWALLSVAAARRKPAAAVDPGRQLALGACSSNRHIRRCS